MSDPSKQIEISIPQVLQLRDNPRSIMFQMLSNIASYDGCINRIKKVATIYSDEELKDPRFSAAHITANKTIIEQYNILMNLDIKTPKNPNDIIEYTDDEELDKFILQIPEYLESKKKII